MSASSHTISSSPFGQPKQKRCSNCGVSFTCGPIAGKGSCWCEELPRVSPVGAAEQDCLCPECLTQAIAKLTCADAHISTSTNFDMTSPATLVEGEDYYCEGAAIVFTAHFLLRRGYCCESGCRHCPYNEAAAKKTA